MRIEGLQEFLSALRHTIARLDTDLSRRLESAGRFPLAQAVAEAPYLTGELSSAGRIEVEGLQAALVFDLEKAPVLEFAGLGGYASLSARWGRPPRFATPAVFDNAEEIERELTRSMMSAFTADGWMRD